MKIPLILFEDEGFQGFLPMVFWRSLFELSLGRKIILDRAAQRLGLAVAGVWTRDWIAPVAAQRCGAPANQPSRGPALLANGRWLPDGPVAWKKTATVGVMPDEQVAYIICDSDLAEKLAPDVLLDAQRRQALLKGVPKTPAGGQMIRYPWEIVIRLPDLLKADWKAEDASQESDISERTLCGPEENLHVGERVQVHPTGIIDTTGGPVYIGDDVSVGAYSVLEGPLYVGPGSRINPHSWLHGGNGIGAVCKIGGEVQGNVIHGYTNKQHVGFLGHSYVGSWVNIGAGACNSDLKNTYGKIRVPIGGREMETGQMFFGSIIGDHAKIGINASLPTGSVVGFAASIAGGMVPKYVPSFAFGSGERIGAGDPLRAMDVASAMMARRHVDLTDEEVELFSDLARRVQEFESRHA